MDVFELALEVRLVRQHAQRIGAGGCVLPGDLRRDRSPPGSRPALGDAFFTSAIRLSGLPLTGRARHGARRIPRAAERRDRFLQLLDRAARAAVLDFGALGLRGFDRAPCSSAYCCPRSACAVRGATGHSKLDRTHVNFIAAAVARDGRDHHQLRRRLLPELVRISDRSALIGGRWFAIADVAGAFRPRACRRVAATSASRGCVLASPLTAVWLVRRRSTCTQPSASARTFAARPTFACRCFCRSSETAVIAFSRSSVRAGGADGRPLCRSDGIAHDSA